MCAALCIFQDDLPAKKKLIFKNKFYKIFYFTVFFILNKLLKIFNFTKTFLETCLEKLPPITMLYNIKCDHNIIRLLVA